MIFSELYGAYYNAVARILKAACAHPLSRAELREIVTREAFGESLLSIEPALLEERWQLLRPDGTTPIRNAPTLPMTMQQRRWLKALSLDPRVRLFPEALPEDPEAEPLFRPGDIDVFDRYADGDPYEDETYIRHFRTVLRAIREQRPLQVEMISARGRLSRLIMTPERLEYSEKDDKFRVCGRGFKPVFVNLARITQCEPCEGQIHDGKAEAEGPKKRVVELELVDERNALERVLMHFAHFEKEAERLDARRYRIRITYQEEDETEMLIRILGFGPVVCVKSPDSFVGLMRERLRRQRGLFGESRKPSPEGEGRTGQNGCRFPLAKG